MVFPSSELAEKLARRRSGETVFEASAAPSTADATAEASSNNHRGVLRSLIGKATARVFERAPSASLADAVHSFETAEVRAISVRETHAFEAALERIRAFELSQSQQRDRQRIAPLDLSGRISLPVRPSISPRAERASASGWSSEATECASAETSANNPREADKREDFKSIVRERYFVLIAQGVEPNAAAARAILEATGQQVENMVQPSRNVSLQQDDVGKESLVEPTDETPGEEPHDDQGSCSAGVMNVEESGLSMEDDGDEESDEDSRSSGSCCSSDWFIVDEPEERISGVPASTAEIGLVQQDIGNKQVFEACPKPSKSCSAISPTGTPRTGDTRRGSTSCASSATSERRALHEGRRRAAK